MNRKETTKFLTDILIANKLSDRKYYAKEVSLDYGTDHTKRVDVMQFVPQGVMSVSDIEKGHFVCYEVKSCREDIFSGNGLNFLTEYNYVVTTMTTYNHIRDDLADGIIDRFLKEHNPESSHRFGIMVPVPSHIDLRDAAAICAEMQNPTKLGGSVYDWKIHIISPSHASPRKKPITELLFCMLRSKHSFSNQ